MKVVINKCFGGFGLSDAAYEKLIEWGIPVQKYIEQRRGQFTGKFLPEPRNDGKVIFDHELIPQGENKFSDIYWKYKTTQNRYWETWLRENRTHPLLIRVVEELGKTASGSHAELTVVNVPINAKWEIKEYDGMEHVAEKHRTWQ